MTPDCLPPLDRGQRERERELPVEEHQAALLELFEHLLDRFHGKAQTQLPTDRGSDGWPVTA